MRENILIHWYDVPNDYKKYIKRYFRIDYVTLLIIGIFIYVAYIGVTSGSMKLINKNTHEIIYTDLIFISFILLMAPIFIIESIGKFMWFKLNSSKIQVRLETVIETHNTRHKVNERYITYTENVDTHYSNGIKYLSRPNSYDVVEKSDRVIVVYLEDTAKYTLLDKYGWI